MVLGKISSTTSLSPTKIMFNLPASNIENMSKRKMLKVQFSLLSNKKRYATSQ